MSYKRQKEDNDHPQKITITNKINRNEINISNSNNEDLNNVKKAFEYFFMNHNVRVFITELKPILACF